MTSADGVRKAEAIAARLRAALATDDLTGLRALLDPHVRWGGPEDTPDTCHTRSEVLTRLRGLLTSGAELEVVEAIAGTESVLIHLKVQRPVREGSSREQSVYQVLTLRDGLVADIRGYPDRGAAAAQAGIEEPAGRSRMEARQVVPILNVSDLESSFDWFERLGWARKWAWCATDGRPTFGAVESGGLEIFLSLNGQGGRGRDGGVGGAGRGVWLSIWVDDVDAAHAACLREDLEVVRPPKDEPWGVREMHVRHPDGHIFRISHEAHSH